MKKKNITVENLATIVGKGFNETRKDKKEIRKEIEDLAIITKKGFDGVDKNFKDIDGRFKDIDGRFDGVDKRLTHIETTMVTKDYLDEKLADLRGDVVILLRKEDRKLEALIGKLNEKAVITDKDVRELREIQIFAQ